MYLINVVIENWTFTREATEEIPGKMKNNKTGKNGITVENVKVAWKSEK